LIAAQDYNEALAEAQPERRCRRVCSEFAAMEQP